MKTKDILLCILAAVLCTAWIGFAARSARSRSTIELELGRTKLAVASDAMRAGLAALDGQVLITWYGSTRAEMPSEYRDVEDGVARFFDALERASEGKVKTAIVHPTEHPDLASHFAALGVAPFRARRVQHDGFVEREIWSSIRISHAVHGASSIPAFDPGALAHAETLLAAHLDLLEHPTVPRVILSATAPARALERAIAAVADVRTFDFDGTVELDHDADLFFWIDPVAAGPEHLRALREFLERGKSVVIAGSRFSARLSSLGGEPVLTGTRTAFPADILLAAFGMRASEEIVLDRSTPVVNEGDATNAPASAASPALTHLVRAIGSNQDFRGFHGAPNGSLLFAAPTLFELDSEALVDLGLSPRILASSSEEARAAPYQDGAWKLAELARDQKTRFAPNIPLAVRLSHVDRWRGDIVVCAASTPFSEEYLTHEAFAHTAFVTTLIKTLAAPERRASQRVAIAREPALPALAQTERWMWRAWAVLAAPIVLLASLFLSRMLRPSVQRAEPRIPRGRLAAGFVCVCAVPLLATWSLVGPALDVTESGENSFAPETLARFARASAAPEGLTIETWFSGDEKLSAELRALARRAKASLRELARRTPGLAIVPRDPDAAEDAALLSNRGIRVHAITTRIDETTHRDKVVSAMVLSRGGERQTIELPDAASFEHLEFRLGYALARLEGLPRAEIAWAAESPRLSPAEAKLEYQDRGLLAPSEGDVYAAARTMLEKHDFAIANVDTRAPAIPATAKSIVWLAPRRDARPLMAAISERLAHGGKALIAAQHYRMRGERRAARNLELALWPQAQFCDLERLYLPHLGIELVRELLFDEVHGSVEVDTRVELEDTGTFSVRRESATSPLFIRASPRAHEVRAPERAASTSVMRGLGDQLFLSGNRILWDDAKLAASGLRAEPLIESSPRTWAHGWTGGDVTPAMLAAPGGSGAYLGPQVLAAAFRGTFPLPEVEPAFERARSSTERTDATAGGDGELVLVGCAEMFQNRWLALDGYDHGELLLRIVASQSLGADLSAPLERRGGRTGLGFVEPAHRLFWRALIVGAAPLLLVAFAWGWRTYRARAGLAP